LGHFALRHTVFSSSSSSIAETSAVRPGADSGRRIQPGMRLAACPWEYDMRRILARVNTVPDAAGGRFPHIVREGTNIPTRDAGPAAV